MWAGSVCRMKKDPDECRTNWKNNLYIGIPPWNPCLKLFHLILMFWNKTPETLLSQEWSWKEKVPLVLEQRFLWNLLNAVQICLNAIESHQKKKFLKKCTWWFPLVLFIKMHGLLIFTFEFHMSSITIMYSENNIELRFCKAS